MKQLIGYTHKDIRYMLKAIDEAHDSMGAYDTLNTRELHIKGGLRVSYDFLNGLLKEGIVEGEENA